MDESRVFGNTNFGKNSRSENNLVGVFKVFKVCGGKFQSCGINFSMRFQVVPELISWRSAENIDFLLDQVQY